MPDAPGGQAMLRLMAWLSPAFPVGSFSYSHGLERAVHDGLATDGEALREWIAALIGHGSGWNDAVLFAEAWKRGKAEETVDAVAELGIALAGSAERFLESAAQGGAFGNALAQTGAAVALPPECPYCVAVGAHAGAAGLPLEAALSAYLQAFVSNQLQAAIRLGVTGQNETVRLLAGFEDRIAAIAARAAGSTLDELGSATLMAEVAAMNHETQYSRLFRT